MRILVTGGAGFIGSHLVDALCDASHEVVVLDDLSTGTRANLEQSADRIRFVEGSVLDADTVDREIAGADLVYHLAAAVGVRHIVDRPLASLLVNLRGTDHVLESCVRHGAKVVLASTSEVYGRPAKIPMSEDDDRVLGSTTVARWSYSTAKAVDEHLALAHAAGGLRVVILRYFNTYGPRIDHAGYGSVVANFLRMALAGEPLTVFGDGTQTRCFTFVEDTVRGTVLAGFTPEAEGRVINIGSSIETSVNELATMIRDAAGSSSAVELQPYETYYGASYEDTPRRVPDISRAGELLGWKPDVLLDEGLARTVEWWRKTHGV